MKSVGGGIVVSITVIGVAVSSAAGGTSIEKGTPVARRCWPSKKIFPPSGPMVIVVAAPTPTGHRTEVPGPGLLVHGQSARVTGCASGTSSRPASITGGGGDTVASHTHDP